MTALSKRLVADDLRRGSLKTVRLAGWPLPRTLKVVRLRDAFVSKAVQHFLQLLFRRMRDARPVDTSDSPTLR